MWLREETVPRCITCSVMIGPGHTAAQSVLNGGIGTKHERGLDLLYY